MQNKKNKLIMLIVTICVSASTAWALTAKCKFYTKGNCTLCGGFMTVLTNEAEHCQEWVQITPERRSYMYVSKSHYTDGTVTHGPFLCTE